MWGAYHRMATYIMYHTQRCEQHVTIQDTSCTIHWNGKVTMPTLLHQHTWQIKNCMLFRKDWFLFWWSKKYWYFILSSSNQNWKSYDFSHFYGIFYVLMIFWVQHVCIITSVPSHQTLLLLLTNVIHSLWYELHVLISAIFPLSFIIIFPIFDMMIWGKLL